MNAGNWGSTSLCFFKSVSQNNKLPSGSCKDKKRSLGFPFYRIMGRKTPHPLADQLLFAFLFCYGFSVFCFSNAKNEDPVGYGYRVRSVSFDPSGRSLTAHLLLIQTSSVFGPDIQNLNLVARYKSFLNKII